MMPDVAGGEAPHERPSLVRVVDRLPSWAFLAALAGIVALLGLLSLANRSLFYDRFVGKYLWQPIVEDSGYNPFNTLALGVVLVLILGWLYRLMAEWDERVGLEVTLGVVPYLVWGALARVLEDADLFAPYNQDLLAARLTAGRSCAPELAQGFLGDCLGVLFITPIIYVWITLVAVFFLWLGHCARRVAERKGLPQGLRFVALVQVVILALYTAWWAAGPTYVRFLPSPLTVAAGCAVALGLVWRGAQRSGRLNPRLVMFGGAMPFLALGVHYVLTWMVGGRSGWGPEGPVHWWIFFAMAVAPTLLAWGVWRGGRTLASVPAEVPHRVQERPQRTFTWLSVVTVVEALLLFVSVLGAKSLMDRAGAGALAADPAGLGLSVLMLAIGPLGIWGGNRLLAAQARGSLGVHPAMAWFSHPVNLLMLWGQSVDAFTTSLGNDAFGYRPKQVVPRTLRRFAENLGLPEPFGSYPSTLTMIPLKVLIVLAVVWFIDVARREAAAKGSDLIGLVKLAIIMVGLSPGVRDGVRLAMGT